MNFVHKNERCLVPCQWAYQSRRCSRCRQHPLTSSHLVMKLFDVIHECCYEDTGNFSRNANKFDKIIEKIKNNAKIGDHLPNTRFLRSQIFRITNNIGIPLLYILLLYVRDINQKFEIFKMTNSLLDINVPWDIPYIPVPSIYHALFCGQSALYISHVQSLYAPIIMKWLTHYMIPLLEPESVTKRRYTINDISRGIITITGIYHLPVNLIELFARAGASPNSIYFISSLKDEKQENEIDDHENNNDDEDKNNTNWRENLHVGSLVDVHDTSSDWISACVIHVDNNDNMTHKSGDRQLTIAYNGWSWGWNECINMNSERLRPFKTFLHENSNREYREVTQQNFNEILSAIPRGHQQWCTDLKEFIYLLTSSISRAEMIVPLSKLIFDYYGSFIPSNSFLEFVNQITQD